jgi:hypothetical protein
MSCYKVKLKKNSKNNEKNQLKKLIKKSWINLLNLVSRSWNQ